MESATTRNRQRTAAQITRSAQQLAQEHGIDGFTMEDLAKAAGVSRRTLFNYVDGKLDAVLGVPQAPDLSRLVEFRKGGPTGRLADDVKAVFVALLEGQDALAADMERTRRLMAADARLYRAMHEKFERFASVFADALAEREGSTLSPLAARAAATMTLSLFDVVLEAYVADPSTSLADYFVAAFDGAATLFD